MIIHSANWTAKVKQTLAVHFAEWIMAARVCRDPFYGVEYNDEEIV